MPTGELSCNRKVRFSSQDESQKKQNATVASEGATEGTSLPEGKNNQQELNDQGV
jgi:hypothetical protein